MPIRGERVREVLKQCLSFPNSSPQFLAPPVLYPPQPCLNTTSDGQALIQQDHHTNFGPATLPMSAKLYFKFVAEDYSPRFRLEIDANVILFFDLLGEAAPFAIVKRGLNPQMTAPGETLTDEYKPLKLWITLTPFGVQYIKGFLSFSSSERDSGQNKTVANSKDSYWRSRGNHVVELYPEDDDTRLIARLTATSEGVKLAIIEYTRQKSSFVYACIIRTTLLLEKAGFEGENVFISYQYQ